MIVKVKRQKAPGLEPYFQSFRYDGPMEVTVSAVLDALNFTDDLYDIDGKPADRIQWACSCMQGICGACAMIINGTLALACNTFLRDIKGDTLILEPLTKFMTVKDLTVDRGIIEESLAKASVFIGEYEKADAKLQPLLYNAAKCLRCGLCLEVCPNYDKGQAFFGALAANQIFLAHTQSKSRKRELYEEYSKHFAAGCSKSLSCQSVCPVNISTLSAMLRLNGRKAGRRREDKNE